MVSRIFFTIAWIFIGGTANAAEISVLKGYSCHGFSGSLIYGYTTMVCRSPQTQLGAFFVTAKGVGVSLGLGTVEANPFSNISVECRFSRPISSIDRTFYGYSAQVALLVGAYRMSVADAEGNYCVIGGMSTIFHFNLISRIKVQIQDATQEMIDNWNSGVSSGSRAAKDIGRGQGALGLPIPLPSR